VGRVSGVHDCQAYLEGFGMTHMKQRHDMITEPYGTKTVQDFIAWLLREVEERGQTTDRVNIEINPDGYTSTANFLISWLEPETEADAKRRIEAEEMAAVAAEADRLERERCDRLLYEQLHRRFAG
jgi:hypothetical protein